MTPQRKKDLFIALIAGVLILFALNNPQFTLTINGIECMDGIELRMNYIIGISVTAISIGILLRRTKRAGFILAFLLFAMIVIQLYFYGLKIFYV